MNRHFQVTWLMVSFIHFTHTSPTSSTGTSKVKTFTSSLMDWSLMMTSPIRDHSLSSSPSSTMWSVLVPPAYGIMRVCVFVFIHTRVYCTYVSLCLHTHTHEYFACIWPWSLLVPSVYKIVHKCSMYVCLCLYYFACIWHTSSWLDPPHAYLCMYLHVCMHAYGPVKRRE